MTAEEKSLSGPMQSNQLAGYIYVFVHIHTYISKYTLPVTIIKKTEAINLKMREAPGSRWKRAVM